MKITKKTVRGLVNMMKAEGKSDDDIYEAFTTGLQQKTITIQVWHWMMETVYPE